MDAIALYGAILSSLLFLYEGYKAYLSRFHFEIYSSLTSLPEIGNELKIWNGSDIPMYINSFDLEFFEKDGQHKWKKLSSVSYPEAEGFCDIVIPSKGCETLPFRDFYHFDWGPKKKIEAVFHVAGRKKSFRKLVWKPD